MRLASRLLLPVARRLPRGSWPLVRLLAASDEALSDYPVQLRYWPERSIHTDLREPVFQMFLRQGCIPHQIAEDRIAARVLREGDVVFDVGANVGYTALMYLKAVRPTGHVHAFEPSVRAFGFCSRNFTQSDPVTLVNKAVGSKCEKLTFCESESLNVSSVSSDLTSPHPRWKTSRTYEVECTTLDAYHEEVTGPFPAFIKVDVEGYESEVFLGMKRILRQSSPVVMFEALSEEALGQIVRTVKDIVPEKYHFRRITHEAGIVPVERRGTSNYLAVPGGASARLKTDQERY